ncbi:MAG: chemotaxis protein CheA, partial [Archangium sp.]|nr:chemotaxis protein CheA [Archangium sp.]
MSDFVAEASELVDALGRGLLAFELTPGDPSVVNELFRAAHSLKGVSAMFGIERVTTLAHAVEDVLEALRLGRVARETELVDALHDAVDVLNASVAEVAAGTTSTVNEQHRGAVVQRLQAATARSTANSTADDVLGTLDLGPARATLTEYEEHRLRANVAEGNAVWRAQVTFSLEDFDVRLATLASALKPAGELVSTLPSPVAHAPGDIAFELLIGSAQSLDELAKVLPSSAAVSRVEVVRPPPIQLPVAFRAGAPEPSLSSVAHTVRVDIGRLDELMALVGELLLVRSNLQQLSDAAGHAGVTPLPRAWAQALHRETRTLERKLDLLQQRVLDARMVPLGQVFDKLSRLMRRLVRDSGKSAEFVVAGADVELDKLIIDELSDPLMHLLRNALDHGLELPELRRSQGKPEQGTIRVSARPQGSHVVIEVTDDGAGLDEARIRDVAVSRGLLTRRQVDDLTRTEVLRLVFTPGFSTRDEVSALSGRGVGLDVVKTNLARLSGILDLESERGRGTTFSLTLPLTLAIVRALLVEVAGERYAVPVNAVLEVLRLDVRDERTLEGKPVLDVRGLTVGLVHLGRHFGHGEGTAARGFVVVVGVA